MRWIVAVLLAAAAFAVSPSLAQSQRWKMYVANEGTRDVSVFNEQGEFLYSVSDSRLASPRQLQLSPTGLLYVASFNLGEILEFDVQDRFVRAFGSLPDGHGLAVASDGRIYFSGTSGQIYSPAGAPTGTFPFPGTALTISVGGTLAAADNGNELVHLADLDGNLVRSFSTQTGSKPRGIAVGSDGLIYVARDLFNDIAVYDTQGALQRSISGQGLMNPYGLAFSPRGTLFVANFGANNILEFSPEGVLLSLVDHHLSAPNHIAFRSEAPDQDGDGYTWPEDCNDSAPSTFPGAPELCDGFDNDCDGTLDNNPSCNRTCDSPVRPRAPANLTQGPFESAQALVAWSGTTYGAVLSVFRDGRWETHFARLAANGTLLTLPILVASDALAQDIVWNGSGYAILLEVSQQVGSKTAVALLDSSGQIISGPHLLSTGEFISIPRALVWTGVEFGVALIDARTGRSQVYFSRLDQQGGRLGPDVQVSESPANATNPDLVWTGIEYGFTWWDTRNDAGDIYFARLDRTGRKIVGEIRITTTAQKAENPDLVWNGQEYGLVWHEGVEAQAYEVHFVPISSLGEKLSSPLIVSASSAFAGPPTIAWTGSEYGICWTDRRLSHNQVFFMRLDRSGTRLGSDLQVSSSSTSTLGVSSVVWNGEEFAVTWTEPAPSTSVPQLWDAYLGQVGCKCLDKDGDGFSVCDECNDDRTDISPLAKEICDGLDNDCDGLIDEEDLDQDGYFVCFDCDDSAPLIHPGAPEFCNGVDDDCNGLIDDDAYGLDSDGDTITNACDNCLFAYNPSQADTDRDRVGNACDNCLTTPNPDQADLDADQRGNICDNCPSEANSPQDDSDGDGVGDVCDNCIFTRNSTQRNVDSDFEGDACDLDDGLLLFTDTFSEAVAWQPEILYSSFNLYRGSLSILRSTGQYTQDPALVLEAARFCGLVDSFAFDDYLPASRKVVYYLVTGSTGGVESTLGTNSAGAERVNSLPCP